MAQSVRGVCGEDCEFHPGNKHDEKERMTLERHALFLLNTLPLPLHTQTHPEPEKSSL